MAKGHSQRNGRLSVRAVARDGTDLEPRRILIAAGRHFTYTHVNSCGTHRADVPTSGGLLGCIPHPAYRTDKRSIPLRASSHQHRRPPRNGSRHLGHSSAQTIQLSAPLLLPLVELGLRSVPSAHSQTCLDRPAVRIRPALPRRGPRR
eukprot:scaffold204119_cov26-Tisochrysis_lutea.AAC.3